MMDIRQQHWLETYRSLIAISMEGFRFSALANGGAAVALLAYLGNLAGSEEPAPDMRLPMFCFLMGLAAIGFSMLFSCFTQLKLLNESAISEKPIIRHSWFLSIAVFLFAISIIAFATGSWQAVSRFYIDAADNGFSIYAALMIF